jgi:hypothetical protein
VLVPLHEELGIAEVQLGGLVREPDESEAAAPQLSA